MFLPTEILMRIVGYIIHYGNSEVDILKDIASFAVSCKDNICILDWNFLIKEVKYSHTNIRCVCLKKPRTFWKIKCHFGADYFIEGCSRTHKYYMNDLRKRLPHVKYVDKDVILTVHTYKYSNGRRYYSDGFCVKWRCNFATLDTIDETYSDGFRFNGPKESISYYGDVNEQMVKWFDLAEDVNKYIREDPKCDSIKRLLDDTNDVMSYVNKESGLSDYMIDIMHKKGY